MSLYQQDENENGTEEDAFNMVRLPCGAPVRLCVPTLDNTK